MKWEVLNLLINNKSSIQCGFFKYFCLSWSFFKQIFFLNMCASDIYPVSLADITSSWISSERFFGPLKCLRKINKSNLVFLLFVTLNLKTCSMRIDNYLVAFPRVLFDFGIVQYYFCRFHPCKIVSNRKLLRPPNKSLGCERFFVNWFLLSPLYRDFF